MKTMSMYVVRMLLVGSTATLKRFGRSRWNHRAGARHIELLECSAHRLALQFESDHPPSAYVRQASRTWPVTFLVDYENEQERRKGMLMAREGKLQQMEVEYA